MTNRFRHLFLQYVAFASLSFPVALYAQGEESEWFVDGELGVLQDSNATRAAWTRDIVEDMVTNVSLGAAWNREFNMMQAMTLRGFVDADQHADLPSLDRVALGVQGIYRWQKELGFTVPFYQASVTLQQESAEVNLRNNDRLTVQAFRTRRVTDAFRYSLGAEGWYQDADGRVFDGSQFRVFVNGDLTLRDPWAIYGTYSIALGDTVSSAQQVFCNGVVAGDIYPLVSAAEEIEADQAFNNDLCGTWLAYRLPAVTHVFVGGINRGFGHHLSVDVSAQHVMVFADGNNEYSRTLLRAGVVARF